MDAVATTGDTAIRVTTTWNVTVSFGASGETNEDPLRLSW
jgi:hypothetical protein